VIRSSVPFSVLCILLAATIAAADQHTYQKGTISAWNIRAESDTSGSDSPFSIGNGRAKVKVYELKGSDLVYKVDYCGAFQAGQFDVGQPVDYRVDGDRLYIRRTDNKEKEYKCKIEGTKAATKPDTPSAKR
jgi:hypothetical protein